MIPDPWKALLKKEKDICNQMVQMQKKTNSNFRDELIPSLLPEFLSALSQSYPTPPTSAFLFSIFEIFLILIQKGILRDASASFESKFFITMRHLTGPMRENPINTISYFVNSLSKLKSGKEDVFLERLIKVSPQIISLDQLQNTLVLLIWLAGHPEYRRAALNGYSNLPLNIQKAVTSELQTEPNFFLDKDPNTFFGNPTSNNFTSIQFRLISGYKLLGGDFFDLPLLSKSEGDYYVITKKGNFHFYFDHFGQSLFPCEKPPVPSLAKIQSSFWMTNLAHFFPENCITSIFETESFAVLTVNFSYFIYLFFKVEDK